VRFVFWLLKHLAWWFYWNKKDEVRVAPFATSALREKDLIRGVEEGHVCGSSANLGLFEMAMGESTEIYLHVRRWMATQL
jgi:hypothetical protein